MSTANEHLTDNIIVKESLMIVENNLRMARLINRRYEPKFGIEGKQVGDTLDIRLPVRYESTRIGDDMVIEAVRERSVRLRIDQLIGQDLEFGSVDLTLKIEQFRERYLDTACASIANRIDKYFCEKALECPNFGGVPGVVPTALDPYFDASVILSNYGTPASKRSFVISPRMEATIVNALKGLFQAAASIAEQYRTGMMGHVIGFDWYMDQNIHTHTVGPLGGTPLTNGVGSGASIVTNGWTAVAALRLRRGDIVTFTDVLGVNPQPPRDSTGELRQAAVTADVYSDGSGNATIPIFPAFEATGAYKNVTNVIASGAAIQTFGHASAYASRATKQGMGFHKEWMTAAFVDMELPKGMEMSARAKSDTLNIAIRIVKGFSIEKNKHLCRLDVLFGAQQMYEDFGSRILS